MDRKKLLIRLTFLILFIFFVNFVAMKFYWYSSLWWLDMPVHFLGGFWLALASIWLFSLADKSFRSIFKIISLVLLVGIFWEIFEIMVNESISRNPFNILDTVSDLTFDLAGGLSAIFYFLKKSVPAKEIDVFDV